MNTFALNVITVETAEKRFSFGHCPNFYASLNLFPSSVYIRCVVGSGKLITERKQLLLLPSSCASFPFPVITFLVILFSQQKVAKHKECSSKREILFSCKFFDWYCLKTTTWTYLHIYSLPFMKYYSESRFSPSMTNKNICGRMTSMQL